MGGWCLPQPPAPPPAVVRSPTGCGDGSIGAVQGPQGGGDAWGSPHLLALIKSSLIMLLPWALCPHPVGSGLAPHGLSAPCPPPNPLPAPPLVLNNGGADLILQLPRCGGAAVCGGVQSLGAPIPAIAPPHPDTAPPPSQAGDVGVLGGPKRCCSPPVGLIGVPAMYSHGGGDRFWCPLFAPCPRTLCPLSPVSMLRGWLGQNPLGGGVSPCTPPPRDAAPAVAVPGRKRWPRVTAVTQL